MVRGVTSVATLLTALAMSLAAPASAQPVDLLAPAVETTVRNNTPPLDIRSATRPPLPGPPAHSNEPPRVFLEAARRALEAGRIGEAQVSLERAEARQNGCGCLRTMSERDSHRETTVDRKGCLLRFERRGLAGASPVSAMATLSRGVGPHWGWSHA
jgi:hypothetical protein